MTRNILIFSIVSFLAVLLLWGVMQNWRPSVTLPSNWSELLNGLIIIVIIVSVVALLVFVADFRKFGLKLLGFAIIIAAVAFWVGPDNFMAWGRSIGSTVANLTSGTSSGSGIPTVTNGTVRLSRGQELNAIFVGTVTVTVPVGYCVRYLPASKFHYDETVGATRSFLTPKSGEPTEIRVRAARKEEC